MTDLTGKTAIITGASRGIGAATARIFAQAGANVVLVARSGDEIARLADEIGDRAMAIPCDISDYSAVEAAVTAAKDRFGAVDILIGNAGVIEPVSLLSDADPDAWGHAIDINLKGVFYGMRAVMPMMQAAGAGTIITISSGAAHGPMEGWSHYCASKAGAAMLTSCADLEGREFGLRIMGLSPGTVATQMQREIKASGVNQVSEMSWEDHVSPDWPARVLLWMCGADADEFVGQELSVRNEEVYKRAGLT